ncbi:MAG: methyltransferase domain-containing protein [Anaerolineae bacterium]|nr:methyltransferase domain-containing protein [Anaerolineae bacterium]
MLEIAQRELPGKPSLLGFDIVTFSAEWPESVTSKRFDAVTSTMAIHHAEDKLQLFQQVYRVLKPGGFFVNGDHVAGAFPTGQYLVGRERALESLGRDGCVEPGRIAEQIQLDERKQRAEGNRCESVAQYGIYLAACGFEDVECLWQDHWLAVLVAHKPAT